MYLLVPDFGGDAVATLKVGIVMLQMVGLHLLEVELERFRMVEVIVREIVEDITKEQSRGQRISRRCSQDRMYQFAQGDRQCDCQGRRHHKSKSECPRLFCLLCFIGVCCKKP